MGPICHGQGESHKKKADVFSVNKELWSWTSYLKVHHHKVTLKFCSSPRNPGPRSHTNEHIKHTGTRKWIERYTSIPLWLQRSIEMFLIPVHIIKGRGTYFWSQNSSIIARFAQSEGCGVILCLSQFDRHACINVRSLSQDHCHCILVFFKLPLLLVPHYHRVTLVWFLLNSRLSVTVWTCIVYQSIMT